MSRPGWARARAGAGPLGPAAERFLEREDRIGEPPLGADGLAWLARRIDAFAERDEASAQDESAFVEGAGSLLALLLLEHVGEGAHASRDGVHRVRLGRAGFFDPFAVIELALDADGARAVLIREVARAEREASGTSGIGAAAAAFERLVRERRGDLVIVDRFDRSVWLEGAPPDGGRFEVDLGRAIDATEDQSSSALEQALTKLVSMLPGGQGDELPPDEAASRLLPRIVAPGVLGEASEGLSLRAIANDVAIALVLAYDGRSRFVRTRELDAWELTQQDAIHRAIANLAARSAAARFARIDTEAGPLVVARTGDGLDSARLLLPSLHDVLAPELGSPFVAAIPHRDALIACAREPALHAALAARAADDAARAPHRITAALFTVSPRGLAGA